MNLQIPSGVFVSDRDMSHRVAGVSDDRGVQATNDDATACKK